MSLRGRTILLTRPEEQSGEFIREVERRGGRVISLPTIEIVPPESWEECDRALESIGKFTGILFTSGNAVRSFVDRMVKMSGQVSIPGNVSVYAVGEATREVLESRGIIVNAVPEEFSGSALAEYICRTPVVGKTFLIPRGNLGRDELANRLREAGAIVETATVYQTRPAAGEDQSGFLADVMAAGVDVAVFASPSAVKNFVRLCTREEFDMLRSNTVICAIGPTTAAGLAESGLVATIVPQKASMTNLLTAIETYFENRHE